MLRKSLKDKTVLITGASTGIGLAATRALLFTGVRVVATARESSMHRFSDKWLREDDSLILRPLDVCNYSEIEALVQSINQEWGGVDILINNAGVSYRTVVEHMTAEAEEDQMRINYLGAFHLIRKILPSMRKKGTGHIVNISSVGGMMAMPTMASYSASKFAMEGASESLWYEVRPWGIDVTLVQPGFVFSNAFRKVKKTEAAENAFVDSEDDYHHYYKGMEKFVERLMLQSVTTPERIANRIVRLLYQKNPPLRIAGTPDARFFFLLRRLMPRRIYHYFLYRSLPGIRDWGKRAPKKS